MSDYSRTTVVTIVEKLHVCLAKAIDTALTNRVGAQWFEEFKESEASEEKPIVTGKNATASSMDLQACLKLLRMREPKAKIVFEYFGHNFFEENEDAKTAKLILNQRLNNLIHNIRNDIYAHAGADMVETGEGGSLRHSVYGMKEAVDDMLKIAYFFKTITDSKGVSYYDMMVKASSVAKKYPVLETINKEKLAIPVGTFVEICNVISLKVETDEAGKMNFLSGNYDGDVAKIKLYISQHSSNSKWYVVDEVIERENLKADTGAVIVACKELALPVSTDINGNLVFSSTNYNGDVARIKLALGGKNNSNNKNTKWLVLVLALVVIIGVIILVVALGGGDDDSDKKSGNKSNNSAGGVAITTEADTDSSEDNFGTDKEPAQPTETEPVATETKPQSKLELEDRTIQGEDSYEEMYFTVDQRHNGKIYLNYENKSQNRTSYQLGFSELQFFLRTESGKEYTYNLDFLYNSDVVSKKVSPGESGVIYLDFGDVDEEIESLSFVGIIKYEYGAQFGSNTHNPAEIEIPIEYID